MALTRNRLPTNEIDSTKQIDSNTRSNMLAFSVQTSVTPTASTTLILRIWNEQKFMRECGHWGAKMMIMDIINERDENADTLADLENRQKITKCGNLQFNQKSNLNWIVWVSRRPHKRRRRWGSHHWLGSVSQKRREKQMGLTILWIQSSEDKNQHGKQ